MSCIAVFGGAGFIGRNLVNRLKDRGKEVFTIDNLDITPAVLENPVEILGYNVRSVKSMTECISYLKPDVVCWFPAKQGYKIKYSDYARLQCMATYGFFEACYRARFRPKKVFLASSQAVYKPAMDVKEDSPKDPPSVYGFSKKQQEEAFTWFCKQWSIPIVSVRYPIVLGAGQSLQKMESGILRHWWREPKNHRRPKIYGTGEQIRDFIHIEDATNMNELFFVDNNLWEEESVAYNAPGVRMSIIDCFKVFKDVTNCLDANITGKDERPGGEFDLTNDANKFLKRAQGFTLSRDFHDMVVDFVESVKSDRFDIDKVKVVGRRDNG